MIAKGPAPLSERQSQQLPTPSVIAGEPGRTSPNCPAVSAEPSAASGASCRRVLLRGLICLDGSPAAYAGLGQRFYLGGRREVRFFDRPLIRTMRHIAGGEQRRRVITRCAHGPDRPASRVTRSHSEFTERPV
jgi:hypothetical protein